MSLNQNFELINFCQPKTDPLDFVMEKIKYEDQHIFFVNDTQKSVLEAYLEYPGVLRSAQTQPCLLIECPPYKRALEIDPQLCKAWSVFHFSEI